MQHRLKTKDEAGHALKQGIVQIARDSLTLLRLADKRLACKPFGLLLERALVELQALDVQQRRLRLGVRALGVVSDLHCKCQVRGTLRMRSVQGGAGAALVLQCGSQVVDSFVLH